MSRVGKKYIDIPDGVSVNLNQDLVSVKSSQGEMNYTLPHGISMTIDNGKIVVHRNSDSKPARALHGLARSLIANMVHGVSKGYQKVLEITGIGYRVQLKGDKLVFAVGYAHPVEYQLPTGVSAAVDDKQVSITLKSINKQTLGQAAAEIKDIRFPDAYKGKGIRYSGERIKLKAGKTGKK
jgi:large subunit ribosomal protein L6